MPLQGGGCSCPNLCRCCCPGLPRASPGNVSHRVAHATVHLFAAAMDFTASSCLDSRTADACDNFLQQTTMPCCCGWHCNDMSPSGCCGSLSTLRPALCRRVGPRVAPQAGPSHSLGHQARRYGHNSFPTASFKGSALKGCFCQPETPATHTDDQMHNMRRAKGYRQMFMHC